MISIELRISNRLCDLAAGFNVRLNRVIYKPEELQTKDAQYSYSISLPRTPVNDEIFGFTSVEEVAGKFDVELPAELLVGGVRVFSGNYKNSSISKDGYKGNLFVAVLLTVKDVFGDMKLNEATEYRIPFFTFNQSASAFNYLAAQSPQSAIFPFVAYGLLGKTPGSEGDYTARDLWDNTVHITPDDLPPSVNVLQMLRHVFQGKGYRLTGTAFSDQRLTQLYMSYKGKSDAVLPWNYGYSGQIRVTGRWCNIYDKKKTDGVVRTERGVFRSSNDVWNNYGCNLLDATNSRLSALSNPGGNVTNTVQTDEDGRDWSRAQIRIPVSGYYKVRLVGGLLVLKDYTGYTRDSKSGDYYVGTNNDEKTATSKVRYGIKLLRDWGKGTFNLDSGRIDGAYLYDNFPQNQTFDIKNTPKYFPDVPADNSGELVLVDTAQNRNFVVGLQWGTCLYNVSDKNPLDVNSYLAQKQAAKPARSWNTDYSDEEIPRVGVKGVSYQRYDSNESEAGAGFIPDDTRFRQSWSNAPDNSARRGEYLYQNFGEKWAGSGDINAVVWFNKGELLTVAVIADEAIYHGVNGPAGWPIHEVDFDLTITPFQMRKDWLKVDDAGNGTGPNNWNDPTDFDTDSINLTGFLPDMKVDDFINNFCKAFNLQLSQVGDKAFSLNVKQTRNVLSVLPVDLEGFTSVVGRNNAPLELPSYYDLGFTVSQDEEGYQQTNDDGGGKFATGSRTGKTTEQCSSFSFNWFKTFRKAEAGGTIPITVPIISKSDVWDPAEKYPDVMNKRYPDLALRFWYYAGLLNDDGATFTFNGAPLQVAKVSNELPDLSILDYKDKPLSILRNYFTVLVRGNAHYTEIEGYLSPLQYTALERSPLVRFNSSVYLIAEVSGYDPHRRNKTKLKLIPYYGRK